MTQLTINIEDQSILPHLKKILKALNGVSIAKTTKKKSSIEIALEDVEKGRTESFDSAEDVFKSLGI